MKTSLKTICDKAFFGEGNKLSIIGIFEEINVTQFPAQHPQMSFVLAVEDGEPNEKVSYYFSINDSTGTEVVNKKDQKKEAVMGNNGRLNLIFNVIGMGFKDPPGPGKYKVTLYVGDYEDYLYFDVKQLPKARA